MLEDIDYGDICVFNNGEEATVAEFERDGSYAITITFNKDVIGYSDRAKEQWCYEFNGRFIRARDDLDGNDIVKVIHP